MVPSAPCETYVNGCGGRCGGHGAGRGGGRFGRREEREREGAHCKGFYIFHRQGKSQAAELLHDKSQAQPPVI